MYLKILKLCKERNLPIYRLEKAAGLSKSSIGKWAHTSPSIDKVVKVAAALGVTIDELLSEDE